MDGADGLSFSGGEPARGSSAIFTAHGGDGPHGALTWTPSEVFVSSAGDMGATWGHFRFVPPVAQARAVTGEYVTVWRKGADGHWKGIMDIGTPDPPRR
jgi:ketosteroid isomerase-like protein